MHGCSGPGLASAQGFGSHTIANVVWSIAKLGHRPDDATLDTMAQAAVEHIKTFETQARSVAGRQSHQDL
jgi:hypothetical protein